jgi:hypothetical protein
MQLLNYHEHFSFFIWKEGRRRVRCTGHEEQMGKKRAAYRILVGRKN